MRPKVPPERHRTRIIKFVVTQEDGHGFDRIAAADSKPGDELTANEWCRRLAVFAMRTRLGTKASA